MAVEWVRSCYRSQWLVWNDSAQPVRGRYYFVPIDAARRPTVPFVGGPTIFCSREWHASSGIVVQPRFGEVLTAAHGWDSGAPPLPRPAAVIVGTRECLAAGESINEALPLGSPKRTRAWPSFCFVPEEIEEWGAKSNVYECLVQGFWADVMALWESGGDPVPTLQEAFPSSVVTLIAGAPLNPPIITVCAPAYAVCLIQPTVTAEQALVEVIEGILPPTNRGGFSTTILWHNQALRALAALSNGGTTTQPVLFVGHSYGGAAAVVAAAICRQAQRNRIIRYLVFGCPRPGDQRLQELAGLPTRGVALQNQGDLIAAIPPQLSDLIPAETVLARILLPWSQWRSAKEVWLQSATGQIFRDQEPIIATGELVALFNHVIATGTFFGIPEHVIGEYVRRIRLRCPLPPNAGLVQLGEVLPALEGPLKQAGEFFTVAGLEFSPPLPGECDIADESFGSVLLEDGTAILVEDCHPHILDETAGDVLLEDGTLILLDK